MKLRKGKTKTILESSIDSALLAVEIYNKPRTTFRSEGYITLMIIAWTRLFHAHFNSTLGDRFYYKNSNGRYQLIDGERRAWELTTCYKKYGKLSESVRKNLEFFVKLRNKIEHRHINKHDVDALIFGECQSLLYNYENLLINLFGSQYALHESLVYSLQFSHLRTNQQLKSSKAALSKDLAEVVSYVEKYRDGLSDDVFSSQEYSIKLLQIPKISNTNRTDVAIEFVRWDELSNDDKAAYERISVLIKDKKIKIEAANVGRLKPSDVVQKVNERLIGESITIHYNTALYKIFSVRPPCGADDPFDTNTDYCHYDEAHNDYLFQDTWVDFIVHFVQSGAYTTEQIYTMHRNGEKLDLKQYIV